MKYFFDSRNKRTTHLASWCFPLPSKEPIPRSSQSMTQNLKQLELLRHETDSEGDRTHSIAMGSISELGKKVSDLEKGCGEQADSTKNSLEKLQKWAYQLDDQVRELEMLGREAGGSKGTEEASGLVAEMRRGRRTTRAVVFLCYGWRSIVDTTWYER